MKHTHVMLCFKVFVGPIHFAFKHLSIKNILLIFTFVAHLTKINALQNIMSSYFTYLP